MDLVERDDKIEQLTQLFHSCQQGYGAVAVISGPVASGKSQLLHVFASEAAEKGAVFLSANGSLAESSMPLGMLGQLLHNAPSADGERRGIGPLDETAMSSMLPALEGGGQDRARAMERLRVELLNASQDRPIVIGIDDADDGDPLSLQCLLYCVRRIRSAPVLVVLTGSESPQMENSSPFAEFLDLPYCRLIRLAPLSENGVAAVLAKNAGPHAAERLTSAWYAVSGGNPLLLHALLEDQQVPGARPADQRGASPVVGQSYRQALLGCLKRSEPGMVKVVRGMAILGASASPKLIGDLVGMDHISVKNCIRALNAAGLLAMCHFRHPLARTAVLESLAPEDRARMHRHAAKLLYNAGATSITVARHILLADHVRHSWMLHVLQDAAKYALTDDRVDLAVEFLELADQMSSDAKERASIKALLASAEWRIDPARTLRHLPALMDALREGNFDDRHVTIVIRVSLWHGRFDDAAAALSHLNESADRPEVDSALHVITHWLRASYPTLLPQVREVSNRSQPGDQPSATMHVEVEAATALEAVLTGGPSGPGVMRAEQVLESTLLDDSTLEAIGSALLALVYAEQLDRATHWCTNLSHEAAPPCGPSRHALLAAVRSEIALRRGDLPAAKRHAWSALQQMSAAAWGVAVGLPLGSLIQASSALGKFDESKVALSQPTPEEMLRCRYGLGYLYARGRYHFSTNRFRAALKDFLTCGELMVAWDMDLPAFVPWRTDAAAAYLRIGNPGRARQLVMEQMNRPGNDGSRSRGVTLRMVAATSELKNRAAPLRESVDILQACGDRFELARSLADLSHVQQALGQLNRARTTSRLASQAARECQAEPLLSTLVSANDRTPPQPDHHPPAETEVVTLSNAERRVAELAARGDTNREIAKRLYITVSTVEQHLTRVYRKLNVTGREDLSAKLQRFLTMAHSA